MFESEYDAVEGLSVDDVAEFIFRVGRKANREITGGDVPSDYPWCEDFADLPEEGRSIFTDAALALFKGDLEGKP